MSGHYKEWALKKESVLVCCFIGKSVLGRLLPVLMAGDLHFVLTENVREAPESEGTHMDHQSSP